MRLCCRLSPLAVLPSRGSAGAAGYDLSSAYAYIVKARGKELVKTDLSIAVPEGAPLSCFIPLLSFHSPTLSPSLASRVPGTYGRIAPRSGLAWKNSIDVGAGVIDADYRGRPEPLFAPLYPAFNAHPLLICLRKCGRHPLQPL